MTTINSKLPTVGTTIFSIMTQLSNEHQAINLAQGFPNFETNKNLVEEVNKAMLRGANQYAAMSGYLPLKEIIAEKNHQFYQRNYHPEKEITITAGATQALFTAIATFIHPGDEVIIFEPAYDCYAPTVKLFGGIVKSFELQAPDYSIDWEMVKKLFSVQTKMIILNSPHNPTGRIWHEDDMENLIKLTKNTDIIILSDEVYAPIIFDNQTHLSVAKYPELVERSLIVSSFGKICSATGWKIGYVLAPENLSVEFRKVHQYNVFSVSTPIQVGIANFLKSSKIYEELAPFFQEKRDFFRRLMKETKFTLLPCKGSYFQCATYEQINELEDQLFAKSMVKEHGVASIPLSAFYSKNTTHKVLRFCFAKDNETLERAVEKLTKIE